MFIVFLFVLLGIAWYTLFERKILSYSQWRVGPNKVILYGIFQPLLDGLKLIIKENNFFYLGSLHKFFFFPVFLFVIINLMWRVINSFYMFFVYYNDLLVFIVFLGTRIFFIILLRIFSNSKFALLGRIRSAAQTIRYEISINFILLFLFVIIQSLNFFIRNFFFFSLNYIVFFLWFVRCLIECNRAPFDFAEGERELIRGFNLEYASAGFIYIFLREYGIILFFRILSSLIFFNNFFFFFFLFMIFIRIRSSYPRYRFDKAINFCWKGVLPVRIFCIFFFKYF